MGMYEFDEKERAALERLGIAMAIYQLVDKRVTALLVTDGMCKLMNKDRPEVIRILNEDMYQDTHPDDKARVADAAYKFASGGEVFDVVYRTMSHTLGDYVIMHAYGAHFFTETGVMLSATVYVLEGVGEVSINPLMERLVTHYKDYMSKESLIRDNFYDTLTGLPNMSYFLQLAEAGKQSILNEGFTPGLLFIDLTGMKYYNQKYGLREGDNLLISCAQILKKYFPNENCGRMGSDHFAVFTKMEGIEDTLNLLFEDIKYANEGRSLPIHVGIYSSAFEDVSASNAFDRAKIASDKEKGAYISKFAYYDENTHAATTDYQYVVNNFERAIAEGWVVPYYQQIVRAVNGLVCDEEALARWIDPVRGMIPPNHFIYVLEDVKLIHKLDLYILERVIKDLEEVYEKGFPVVPVSINLSKYDFELCDMVDEIIKRVEASKITAADITIEITESVSELEPEFVARQIDRFHEAGFKVWMDDFGSGYSSLNMLQRFDFDVLKFDMRFMREFKMSRKNHTILKQLVQMAKKLGIDTVIEGVETIEQVKFLREIGASKLQGFYFAKPIPLDEWYDIYGANVGNRIEKPEETEYYDVITKVNVVEPEVNTDFNWRSKEFFGQLPTGVIEIKDDALYIIRYNKTFANFLLKAAYIDETDLGNVMIKQKRLPAAEMMNILDKCIESKRWELVEGIDEVGMKLDLFLRFIGENPLNNHCAFEVVIISVTSEE